ncbi:hypothetical protein VARIO8X_90336 [Burkholderiales bacterium 8X]|nr:hypothetical protein VARIO8X_90336 [Burkholderiales bacterium 8X]
MAPFSCMSGQLGHGFDEILWRDPAQLIVCDVDQFLGTGIDSEARGVHAREPRVRSQGVHERLAAPIRGDLSETTADNEAGNLFGEVDKVEADIVDNETNPQGLAGRRVRLRRRHMCQFARPEDKVDEAGAGQGWRAHRSPPLVDEDE